MQPGKGIQEVADKAGVSITTVSHALSGKGRIAPATRERIHRIAADLGYRPHASARNLAARKTGLLGLAVSQAAEQSFAFTGFAYFMHLMGEATKAALEQGYALVLVPPADNGADRFESLPLDGAVIIDPIRNDPLVTGLRTRSTPFVTTGRVPDGLDVDDYWVDNDHVAGTHAMLQHLERSGARRIALLTARPFPSYAIDAITAYEAWSAHRGTEPLTVVSRGELTESQGYTAASELFDLAQPPDAIYATIDTLALGALRAAHVRGLSIPDDVLIASCTDNDALRTAEPPLTALNLHPNEIGRLAIEMLVALVDGHEPPEAHLTVRSRVAPRASTRRRGRTPTAKAVATGSGRARR
ncbi:MAG: LacI family DNA-binding transcriptional regulator [Solirubrobacteraceae bacterium]